MKYLTLILFLLGLICSSFSTLYGQSRDSLITKTQEMFEAEKYYEVISLLQDSTQAYPLPARVCDPCPPRSKKRCKISQ